MLPSSDSEIYGLLREIGLLAAWSEDEFLTLLARQRKTVRARDEAVRTSEAIVQILTDGSRPEAALCRFGDGGGEAIQAIEIMQEASPDLAERLEYVDEAWEWDAYEDDEAREAGAELDERFGPACLLTVSWKGREQRLFFRTLADLSRLVNGLLREDGVATRFYVVSQLGKEIVALVLDEERVRKLNASGILQPDEAHLSVG